MKNFLPIFLTLLLSFLVSGEILAQERGGRPGGRGPGGEMPKARLKGKVVDADTKTPLGFATVTLISKRDSSVAGGGITDDNGVFDFETRPGRFTAKIEFISYEAKEITDIRLSKDNLEQDLGTIELFVNAATLAEVEVRAEKSTMQMSLDKKVFNVGKDLATRGGSAEDILDNVPSVTVDIEGNVELRGGGVRLLIDGKPSGMLDGANGGLKSIPANLIDRVEVITNPSARYQAEGMTGIINIILRKEKKKGVNGSFDLNVGTPTEFGAAINLNFRKDKINFFVNYGVRYNKTVGGGFTYQERVLGDSTLITDQINTRRRGGWSNSIRLGADYYFSEKDILTTSFLYKIGDDDNISTTTYNDFWNSLDNPIDIETREDAEFEDEQDLEYSISYKKLFKKKRQEWTVDLRYQDNEETEGSDFTNSFANVDGTPTGAAKTFQNSRNAEGSSRLIIQTDYVEPIGKDGKYEFGAFSSFRKIDNDYTVNNLVDGVTTPIDRFTNEFLYDEDIYAVYGIYGNKTGKFSYQVGLRMEHSEVSTELRDSNYVNPRSYTNLFPSGHLNYDLGKDNAVQVSYSRRIQRPRFWYLNPFFTFSDNRNFFSGNPDLDPEFTDSYELSHIKYWNKTSITTSLYYRKTTGVIQRILQDGISDGELITIRAPYNLSTRDAYGLEFTFNLQPAKWARFSGNANFFQSKTVGTFNGEDLSAEGFSWFARTTSQITIAKKLETQIRFNYRGARPTVQGRSNPVYSVDLGMSLDVLKNNGTVTLSARDLFNSRKRRSIVERPDFFQESEFQWRPRQITLSLNYRLNQKKKRGRRGGSGGGGGNGGEF